MPIDAIVLSRTEMWADKFCSTVAVQDRGQWRQVRPLLPGGAHLTTGCMRYPAMLVDQRWVPGRIVTFDLFTPSGLRPTHPEDYIIDPALVTIGAMANLAQMQQAIQTFTHPSLQALFPGYITQGNGKIYMNGNQRLAQSIGYVQCGSVVFRAGGYAEVTTGGVTVTCKVKDTDLLARLNNGTLAVGTRFRRPLLRFALATPSDWEGRFTIPRCYIMLTGMV